MGAVTEQVSPTVPGFFSMLALLEMGHIGAKNRSVTLLLEQKFRLPLILPAYFPVTHPNAPLLSEYTGSRERDVAFFIQEVPGTGYGR